MRGWLFGILLGTGLLLASAVPSRAQEEHESLPWRQEYVRVTFYTLPGLMYNQEQVHKGAAACSWGFPLGTQLRLPDGWVVTCKDRGYLGLNTGWVDIWAPSRWWGLTYVERDYGRYAWVSVTRWGWED